MKISVDIEMPKDPEYKPCLTEKVQDAMERVEFNEDTNAYKYLRCVLQKATTCYKEGKRSDKLHKILGLLTPFMVKHGLEDHRGMELVEGYVTNANYQEDTDEN